MLSYQWVKDCSGLFGISRISNLDHTTSSLTCLLILHSMSCLRNKGFSIGEREDYYGKFEILDYGNAT